MPLYEYECLECGARFEKLQRYGEPDPRQCPNGHNLVHRLLSPPTVIFKGPGFYATDNRRNGTGKSSRKTKPESTDTSSTKTEKETT